MKSLSSASAGRRRPYRFLASAALCRFFVSVSSTTTTRVAAAVAPLGFVPPPRIASSAAAVASATIATRSKVDRRFLLPGLDGSSPGRTRRSTGAASVRTASALSASAAEEEEEDASKKKLSIAIVGSGAVGSYYGARLWECDGYDVRLHMRGDHYRASVENGLRVKSVDGDIYIPPERLRAYESTSDMGGVVDWVIVALKSTSLDAVPSLIEPLLGPETRVLAIMNGLIDDDLVAMLESEAEKGGGRGRETKEPAAAAMRHPAGVAAEPPRLTSCRAVYGGMALICSNRIGPGVVDHTYAGLLTGGLAASSSSSDDDVDRKAFEDLWEPTDVPTKFDPSLVRGRWTKNVWNLPFNGISVSMGGITVDRIVTDPGLRRLADVVMDETISVANADLESRGIVDPSQFLGDAEKKQMMDLSDGMGPYKTSTMLDMLHRKPMEVKYLFGKAVERARRLNVPVPHLETLVTQIEAFQRFYDLY